MTNIEFVKVFEQTIKQKPFSLSDNTIKSYLYHIGKLIDFVDDKPISEITTKDIKKYLFDISSNGASDTTYNLSLAAFKCLYKALGYNPLTEDDFTTNPALNIVSVRNVKQEKKTPLNEIEKQALLRNCKNERQFAILTTYLNTGLRVHELVNLTLEQYQNRDENGRIKLTVNKGSYDDEYIYITMPYDRKGSLNHLLDSRNLTVREIIKYSLDFLLALCYIHDNNMIHCVLKPNNILIDDNNKAILSDFGSAIK